jgi:hypothetical protein
MYATTRYNFVRKTNLKRKSSESKGKVGNKVTGKEAVEKSEHYEASQDVSSKAVVNIKQKDEEYVSELLETVEVVFTLLHSFLSCHFIPNFSLTL